MHHYNSRGEQRHDRQWRRFEAMARRGFRGFGNMGGFGANWGGFGDNFRVGRMLASGDLRLVALFFIEEQPRHGYDLIKAIEEKTAGFYSPSPGIVYPALTFLEEAGYVTSSSQGNKKLYTITEEGAAHLAANREAVDATLRFLAQVGERMHQWRDTHDKGEWPFNQKPGRRFGDAAGPGGPFGHDHHHGPDRDIPGALPEVNEARKALKRAIAETLDAGDEDAQRRLADILRKAAELIRRDDVDL